MNWEAALFLSTLLGQVAGFAGRIFPFIPNQVIPKIVLGVNILGNLLLVANKFLEAAAIGVPGVAWYVPEPSEVAAAGFFGFLKPLLVAVGAAAVSAAQLAVQRWVHEKALKPAVFTASTSSF
jgi:hypothetical protein